MILEKGIIPPNALFEKMNPGIDAQLYNVQVRDLDGSMSLFAERLSLDRSQQNVFHGLCQASEEFL